MSGTATIFVKSLEPMVRFYETCFGLEVAEACEDYCILESDAWTLSIVQVPRDVASSIALANPPIRRDTTPIKVGFEVSALAVARAAIVDRGGQVDDLEWEFRGYRHCDFVDPEGNVNQLREAVAPTH